MRQLLAYFGTLRLSQLNGTITRAYIEQRQRPAAARRELEDLRAAINHYAGEGLLLGPTPKIAMPARGISRERWLTRTEAARFIWRAWRHREEQLGNLTARHTRRHVAKFTLVALYTGTRAGAICAASFTPEQGRGWIDLRQGVFYRRPQGARATKKAQPPVPLPRRLLAHLRRWKRLGQRYVVEWNGEPIGRMAKAFRSAAKAARLRQVTPHTLRHTAATWLMQRGAPLWAASGYLGMSPDTLARIYGHHHPDHLKEARDVFDRPARKTLESETKTRNKYRFRKRRNQSTRRRAS